MRNTTALLAAASLTVGGLIFAGNSPAFGQGVQAQGQVQLGQRNTDAASLPQGISRSQQQENQAIDQVLAKSTDAAVSDNVGDLLQYLSQKDQQRLQQFKTQSHDDLKQSISQFQENWQEKYNQDFSIDNPEVVFGQQFQGFQIAQGEITNPALLSNWPVDKDMQQQRQPQAGQVNLQKGQHVAVATFPQQGGASELTVSLVKQQKDQMHRDSGMNVQGNVQADTDEDTLEGRRYATPSSPGQPAIELQPDRPATGAEVTREMRDNFITGDQRAAGAGVDVDQQQARTAGQQGQQGQSDWKLDIPDSISSQQLASNLNEKITALNDAKDQWPSDATQAKRIVSHQILSALYETGQTGQQQQQYQQQR